MENLASHTHYNWPSSVHCLLISDSSLVELIRQQNTNYPVGARLKQGQVEVTNHISTASDATTEEMALKPKLSKDLQYAKGQANEKGPCHG